MNRLTAIIFLTAGICFTSCRTVRVIEQVPVEVHDTTYIAKTYRDSIYVDRWHTVEVKGDTIFVTNEVTKTRIVTKIDTAYRYIERPVIVSKTETIEVAKPLTWWQRTLIYIGIGAVVLLVLWVLLRLVLPKKLPTKNGN